MKLKPNCLITRRPIRLITGPRSVFFYNAPWGDLPYALQEHGYKAELLHLPFSDTELRKSVFNQKLIESEIQTGVHFIVDLMTYQELNIQPGHSPQCTFTVITSKEKINLFESKSENLFFFDPEYKTRHLGYFLHQKWCAYRQINTPEPAELFLNAKLNTYYRFIDHSVMLAELDFLLKS